MKRQAYGYRDQEFFELKYYQCMTPSTDLSDEPFFNINLLVSDLITTFAQQN